MGLLLATCCACGASYTEFEDAGDGGSPESGADAGAPEAGDPPALVDAATKTDTGSEDADAGREPDASADAGLDASADAGADADADAEVDAGPPCATGYTRATPDAGCTFANPFADPSFQGSPPNAWELARGAVLLPTAAGFDDVGVARLANSTASTPYVHGSVEQSIVLPTLAASEPLALKATAAVSATFLFGPSVHAYIDDVALLDPSISPNSVDIHVCLGALAYGGVKRFAFDAGYSAHVDLDHVAIVPDPGCPAPGIVKNGNFDGAGGFTTSGSGVSLTDGTGTGGSRGARFKPASLVGSSIQQKVSIPKEAGTALTMRTYGKGNFHVLIDGNPIRMVTVSGSQLQTVCLPAWTRGIVATLQITAGNINYYDPAEASDELTVDDIAFGVDDACTNDVAAQNRDFETAGGYLVGWFHSITSGYDVTRGTVGARTGGGYLAMKSTPMACGPDGGSPARVMQTVTLPKATALTGGPSVQFWYRFNPGTKGTAQFRYPSTPLPAASDWTEKRVCLEPGHAGGRAVLFFELDSVRSECTSAALDVDDVVVGNDLACPFE